MFDKRAVIQLFLFFTMGLGLFTYSLVSKEIASSFDFDGADQESKINDTSFFISVDYYVLKEGDPFMYLNGRTLTIDHAKLITTIDSPNGKIVADKKEKDKRDINYEADNGVFYDAKPGGEVKQRLYLSDDVHLDDGMTQIDSDQLTYYFAEDKVNALGNVKTESISIDKDKIQINSHKARSWPSKGLSEYRGNVRGKILRDRLYEESLTFKTDQMKMSSLTSLANLEGNVEMKKQGLTATSRRGEVYLENYNKKLKYFALYDDVKVSEVVKTQDAGTITRESFSEKLEGFMSDDRIVLTGYPKVIQEDDIIKGNTIILRQNNQVVEVDDANTNFYLKE